MAIWLDFFFSFLFSSFSTLAMLFFLSFLSGGFYGHERGTMVFFIIFFVFVEGGNGRYGVGLVPTAFSFRFLSLSSSLLFFSLFVFFSSKPPFLLEVYTCICICMGMYIYMMYLRLERVGGRKSMRIVVPFLMAVY